MSEKYFTRFASKSSIRSYMFHCQKIKICENYQNIKKQIIRDNKFSSLQYLSQQTFFKASSKRLDQNGYIRLGHTSSRRLQGILKTFSRRLATTSSKRLSKMSSRRLQDVLLVFNLSASFRGCLQRRI